MNKNARGAKLYKGKATPAVSAKPIPETFTKSDFSHRLIDRLGDWCLFERQHLKSKTRPHYEVVKPVIGTKEFRDGEWRDCDPRELYPSAEQWGTCGFTLNDEAAARNKLKELTK